MFYIPFFEVITREYRLPLQDMTLLTSVRVFFGLLYTMTFFSGIFLNTCVIYAVAKNRRLQVRGNRTLLGRVIKDTAFA